MKKPGGYAGLLCLLPRRSCKRCSHARRSRTSFTNPVHAVRGSNFLKTPLLRFTTAGESHGPALISVLEGMPAGLPLLAADVDVELARRQQGYGRGRRMQIERDAIEFLAGVRAGETIGAPIAMLIRNRDWENWQEIMDPAPR